MTGEPDPGAAVVGAGGGRGGAASGSPDPIYWRLAAVGVFMLFLELVLIRWLATEIRVFAYFKNLTLVACFLGMGLGCLLPRDRRGPQLGWTSGLLALLALAVVLPKALGLDLFGSVNRFLAERADMPLWVWGARTTTLGGTVAALVLLILVFLLVAAIFLPPGRLLGLAVNAADNKYLAYASNVLGSLGGIALFQLVSYLSWPPAIWFAAIGGLALTLVPKPGQRLRVTAPLLAVVAVLLLVPNRGLQTVWSPYQKITWGPLQLTDAHGQKVEAGYRLNVNEAFHQNMVNLSPEFLGRHLDVLPKAQFSPLLGYNTPYRFRERPAEVLIIGAGTGNDVAAALRNGAERVDAVEIDPEILALGRRLHPERPYDDPRVRVVIDDARSFLKRTSNRYDLIVFGALDSHTVNSEVSNLRIDTYIYTMEAFEEVRAHLRPGGVVWLLHAFEKRFIGDRLYGMLEVAFGRPPIAFYNQDLAPLSPAGGGGTFVADLDGRVEQRMAASPLLTSIVAPTRMALRGKVLLADDDWPYLYVRDRAVPSLYLVVMGIIIAIAVALVRPAVGRLRRLDWHFFALGAAFLLLEVQSINRMTLLLGNTWKVNAVVIASVLVMALLATLCAARLPAQALPLVFLGLAAALVVSFEVPISALLALAEPGRTLLACGLTALPLFFAGIVFSRTFATARESAVAMGSNLLGAIVGGTLESAAFVIGLNALLLIALLLYATSFVVLFARGELRLLHGGSPAGA